MKVYYIFESLRTGERIRQEKGTDLAEFYDDHPDYKKVRTTDNIP